MTPDNHIRSFDDILDEINQGEELATSLQNDEYYHASPLQEFPLIDDIEHTILMHRDVHFGGNFSIMLDYYEKEGKGISSEFEIDGIQKLSLIEETINQNIAPILLTGAEMEQVATAKQAYKKIKEIYDLPAGPEKQRLTLIANLIFSEDRSCASEISAIVACGTPMIPSLLTLLQSEEFLAPLFPGYGLAPAFAARCIGKIGDTSTIVPLFETIGKGDFFTEENVLDALQEIGEPTKAFLLSQIHHTPITKDNENAAIALTHFPPSSEIAHACLSTLQQIPLAKHASLASYLVLSCESLDTHTSRAQLITLADDPNTPDMLSADMKMIIQRQK